MTISIQMRFLALSLVLSAAMAPSFTQAAYITSIVGGVAGSTSYSTDLEPTGTTTQFQGSVNSTIQGRNSTVLLRAGGGVLGNAGFQENFFSLSTKVSVTGSNASGVINAASRGNFDVVLEPGDLPGPPVPGNLGSGVMKTKFSWAIHGEVAPGGTVAFTLSNFVGSVNSTVVTDFNGSPVAYSPGSQIYSNPLTATNVLPFSFAFEYESARWSPERIGTIFSSVGITLVASHVQGVTGTSWVGFSDPGTVNLVTSASVGTVPEPLTLSMWLVVAVGSGIGIVPKRFTKYIVRRTT